MTQAALRPHDQLTHDEFTAISKAVHEFETLWRQTRNPAIEPFLSDVGDPLRLRLLIELLRIDQEHRWERGEHRLLEQYLPDWPELTEQPAAIQELLDAECLTRFCLEDSPTRDELRQRFPQFADAVDLDRLRATAVAEKGDASTAKAGGNEATLLTIKPPQVGDEIDLPATTSFPAKSETSAVLAARRIGLLTGKQFGRYEVRRMVGSGGMGAVYEARDTQLDRIVALKIPRGELVNDPVILQRFLNEARAAGAIRHPNICPIYDVGQLDGQHFITMPLVEGMSLSAWMEHRTVSLRDAVELTRKLASALQAIHAVRIRHRDIKASNVMIDERGEPLLMDFGLARLAQTDTQLTQSGSLVGTPAYMAPEQIQLGASGGDERSDVYSLGVLLYQMLTGRLPFEGPMTRVLVDIATKTPPPVESLRPDVDADLAAACRKAMSREPSTRYQTAGEFEAALVGQAFQPDPNASPIPTPQKTAPKKSEPKPPKTTPSDRATAPSGQARKPDLRWIVAAFLFALAAAIVIKISDSAELVITSPEPGLEVKIVQLAQPEQERTLTFGKNSVRVRSGQVEVVLTGANADEYEVVGDKITLKRFGQEVVEIKRRETGVAASPANVSSPSPITDEHLREVVRWVLSFGGSVEASFNGRFVRLSAADAGKPLPEGRPIISTIGLDSNPKIHDEDLARLADLPDLENLTMSTLPITDRGMDLLGSLPKLRQLLLSGIGLTEKSLVPISRWTSIEDLSLSQTEFTDSGVEPLAKLTQLRSLRANNLTMTAAQTDVFRMLPAFETLWLQKEKLNDSTLANVAKLPHLKAFSVTFAIDSKITSEGARLLAEKRDLVLVNLGGTPVKNTGLAHLCRLLELEHLCLDMTQITDDGLSSLTALRKLKSLWLGNNRISDRGFAVLQSLKTLETLLLNDTDVTDAGLKHLTGLSLLKTLNLDGTKVSAEGVASLKKKLPNCNITAKHMLSPAPAIAPFTAERAKQHQEAWAKYLDVPVEYSNTIGMKFRLIPPGEFLMGSTQREIDETISRLIPDDKSGPAFCRSESPQHKVALTQPFYVGIYEVTQQEYETVLGTNPSQFSANGPRKDAVAGMETGKHPVELVQFRDAADFCAKLSAKEKLQPCYFKTGLEVTVLEGRNGYRFPTEAQWEFACRAGTTTKYWNGDTDEGLVQIGWFNRNSGDRTHAVGELNANPFGLYDVHGNVREYCQDWFDEEFYKTFQDKKAIDPLFTTRTSTSDHLVRGGGAQSNSTICRSASRHTAGGVGGPGHNHVGFRAVLSVDAVRQTLASGNLAADRDREVAWWVLAGNELRNKSSEVNVDLYGVKSTFTSTEQLPSTAFAITELTIYGKPFQANDLEKLAGLPRLAVLRFILNPVGDDLTRHLGRLTGLVHLQLNQCGLTDVGVERLETLSKLQYLDVNWSPGITDRGLSVVERMPQLGTLSLINTSVTDKGLSSLHQLPLEALFLSHTKVTDAGMTVLSQLRTLEVLDLQGTSVGDDGVAQLSSLSKLRMLALQKTALTDQGMKHLATVRSLQTLHVGGTKVTADGIAELQKALPNCKITNELLPSEPPKPTVAEFAQWMKQVASRSADGQVVEVVKKLRELKPEFDGNFSHKVEKGAVTELLITSAHIVDISPIRALSELKTLRLAGTGPNQIGQLVDLSPLAGMKLTSLDCSFTRVKDLSPLKGMKLTKLNCGNTEVDDLSPLAQMPLTDLSCGYTSISDLSPLKEMPLTKLDINSTHKITDLTALKGLPLTELVLFHNFRVTDLSPLEGMKLTVLDCFTTGVTDLSPLKGMPLTFLQCANTKVSDLSPLEGMPLTVLYCFSTQVEDLSPLKGMPLRSLLCNRTRVNDAALKHLSGLSELKTLDLADTKVSAAGIATLQEALPNCKITVELSPSDRPK